MISKFNNKAFPWIIDLRVSKILAIQGPDVNFWDWRQGKGNYQH